MNAILSNPERERLAKLLGMLGSDHAGERDAAGLAAHRLVKASGVTWSSIVCIPQDAYRRQETSAHDWRSLAMACTRFPLLWDKWESEFVYGLPRFPRLSIKQGQKLTAIVTRLQAAGCAI
jgi:hypothetical protein